MFSTASVKRAWPASTRPSARGHSRRFDAAGVPVLVEEHDDIDVAETSQVGGELAGLLTAQLEQERSPGPEEAAGPGHGATKYGHAARAAVIGPRRFEGQGVVR